MRLVFCDDNEDIPAQPQKYVASFFRDNGNISPEYASYTRGDALLAKETFVDIAFLDVEMPGLSGLHVAKKLKEQNRDVILFVVTSYPDYLDDAMRTNVFRFLSKPIDKQRLFRNLKDALRQYSQIAAPITVETQAGTQVLRTDEILFAEVLQRKTILHTSSADLVLLDSYRSLEEKLPVSSFYETFRGILVNLRYVVQIKKDIVILRCFDREFEVYLARRKYADFKKRFDLYLVSTS